jgi:ActR/RegA family two-component response regulator
MKVLVIVPGLEIRDELRARLWRRAESLRAQSYEQGLVFAEQELFESAIVWVPSGADAKAVDTVQRLHRLNRDMRLIVITPKMVQAGVLAFVERMMVDAYLVDNVLDEIVAEALGVPKIVDGGRTPPTPAGGSSAGLH